MDSNLDQHNKGGLLAFLFSVIFCVAFFIYIGFIHEGVDLKEVQEEQAGSTGPNLAAVDKPWVDDAAFVERGAQVYALNCASCHGEKGTGDGVAGAALNPKPRDLVEGKWTKGGQSHQLYETITVGIPGTSMAPFGHLSKVDRWALVQFIRSITKNKPADNEAEVEKYSATAK